MMTALSGAVIIPTVMSLVAGVARRQPENGLTI